MRRLSEKPISATAHQFILQPMSKFKTERQLGLALRVANFTLETEHCACAARMRVSGPGACLGVVAWL